MSLKDQFLNYIQVEKRFSNHTLLAYEQDLNQFVTFATIKSAADWNEVNHQLIRAWMVELLEAGQSSRTVNRKLSCLRSFFKWGKNNELIAIDPMVKVRGPKSEKRLPQFVKQTELSDERIASLFSDGFEGLRDRLMIELFYQTGIRLSELLTLKESAISATAIKVLGKRNKERIIPIGPQLHQRIQAYRSLKPAGVDSQNMLFVKKDGVKLSSKFVYRKINLYLGSVTTAQKKSPHVLRHTFATHLLNNGAGLETLKELLGHANLSATQVYTHNSFAQINTIYSQAHPRGHKK